MGRPGGLLLKAFGLLVVAFVALSAVATIVGIVFGIVATIVSLVVTLAVAAALVLAAAGLFGLVSLARGGDDETTRTGDRWAGLGDSRSSGTVDDRDAERRLRDRYVAGEIDEAEYERKLELLLGSSDADERVGRTERSDRSLRDRLLE